ncbi:MAG: T9SS type A sorting domain-containing protein, partial [Sphingobacteriales bacterium]
NLATNNAIVLTATTAADVSTACSGTSSEAQQGAFSAGYEYAFQTSGTDVTVTFKLLDTDKVGVVAYLWQQTPFSELQMSNTSGLTFTRTLTGQAAGTTLSLGVKFAFAGGLAVTKYFTYTVGEDCALGIGDPDFDSAVRMYPNPANTIVHIESGLSPVTKVALYSLLGSTIIETTAHDINVGGLARGLYLVKIYSGNTFVTKKLMVQ